MTLLSPSSSSYKKVTVAEMKKRWTRFYKYVVKNYANHGHSNGRDCDGETIPAFVRPLHDYILNSKPTGTVARQEKERVDGVTMPRQRPLGNNVLAEPRSERLDVNAWNGITDIQPNQDVEYNRAVPINIDIEATTIRVDGTRGGDDERQPPKKGDAIAITTPSSVRTTKTTTYEMI